VKHALFSEELVDGDESGLPIAANWDIAQLNGGEPG
jgi:hypothetical protein